MGETTRHRHAFDLYWQLGAERSVERLHQTLRRQGKGPSLRTLYQWSSRFRWQDRVLRLEQEARRVDDESRIEAIREMHDRHAREAVLLQRKGSEWLATIDSGRVTVDAAIRAVVEGVRMERLARGEPSEKREVSGELDVSARLAELSDDELDGLIQYAERPLAGETAKGAQ